MQTSHLLRFEVLPRQALGRPVAAHAVVLATPPQRVPARSSDVEWRFAAEAVLGHYPYGALHARLVRGLADSSRVDHEAPRLRVLEEGEIEGGLQRVRLLNESLGVVRNQDIEHAPVERHAASHASIAVSVVSRKSG